MSRDTGITKLLAIITDTVLQTRVFTLFRAEYKLDDAFPEYIGANGILHSFHHRGESDTGIIGRLRVPSDTTSRMGGTSKDVPINKIHGGYIKRRRDRAHEMNIKVIRPVLGRG